MRSQRRARAYQHTRIKIRLYQHTNCTWTTGKLESGQANQITRPLIKLAVSSETAGKLRDMMVSVVKNGTANLAQIPGVEVAGKTGTAETAEGQAPHAWFISFAPANKPQVALAVMVESAVPRSRVPPVSGPSAT